MVGQEGEGVGVAVIGLVVFLGDQMPGVSVKLGQGDVTLDLGVDQGQIEAIGLG